MNTTVKTCCPSCGDVDLTPYDVALRVCADDPAMSYYRFVCPDCSEMIWKPAPPDVVMLLVSGGIPAQVWQRPAETLEPHVGPPLTHDDLLDLMLELATL